MITRIASHHVVDRDGSDSPATITVEAGRISDVSEGIDPKAELVDEWILPGYVDTHCHGGAGADFTDPDRKAALRAVHYHRSQGSTTLFASTVTAAIDDVVAQIGRLRQLVDLDEIAGIHLEGPFLAESRKGAHAVELLCDPDPVSVGRLIEAGGSALKMVTIAPERAHGLEAVTTFTTAGVHAAIGHTECDNTTASAAVDAGADVITHLFNAMPSIHHRKPGPVPPMLTDSRVVCELICDGVHLAPDVIRMAMSSAGPKRIALVTDAMSATGQPDGDYILGSLPVKVVDGRARLLAADGSLGAIAGSTLTMGRAVEFVTSVVGIPLGQVAVMAATTPAKLHGLNEVGVIEEGHWADLCLTDAKGHLVRVIHRGEAV